MMNKLTCSAGTPRRGWIWLAVVVASGLMLPRAASGGATDVAAGGSHTCVVTDDGVVRCWGQNTSGQLGDGTFADSVTPVVVSGLVGDATAVAAGGYHACAVMADGAVWCWGGNFNGQLGDATTVNRSVPVPVSGLGSGVAGVSAASSHTCAVTSAGAVWCWGWNGSGQLGDGTTTNRSVPVPVSGLGSGVVAVTTGNSHTCAVTSTGAVWCWGANFGGQLGDGTTTPQLTPVAVSGLGSGSGVVALAAGYAHACAVTSGGAVFCWGSNSHGQLGDGTFAARPVPAAVVGLVSGATAVTAGSNHTCATTPGGAAWCWGGNTYGQLGDGTLTNQPAPVAVSGVTRGVAVLAAGSSDTCVATSDGTVMCWGQNYYGELGDGTSGSRSVPGGVVSLSSGAIAVAAGDSHACAATNGTTSMWCWGANGGGQLGDGTQTNRPAPVAVSELTGNAVQIAAGDIHTCAVTGAGAAWCWGYNGAGRLGDGTTVNRSLPAAVSGLGSGVVGVAAGDSHTCAVTSGGAVWCWGDNSSGQLGDGTATNRSAPVAVGGLSGAVAVTTGDFHSCAVTSGGAVWCWGSNVRGQLGDGTTTNRSAPVAVTGLATGAIAVAAGGDHTCAVTAGGALSCWGHNGSGELGDGTTAGQRTPVPVIGLSSGVAAVAAGSSHTCAVTSTGALFCWGQNYSGRLGDGTQTARLEPVAVSGLGGVLAVAAGNAHTCAVTTGGGVWCWGANFSGQLGDGTVPIKAIPVRARGLPGEAVRYFAEGANEQGIGFETRLAFMNPNLSPTWIALEFQTLDGATISNVPLYIGAQQRLTVDTWTGVPGLANASFSTIVRSNAAVVADRTMRWNASGYASHAETAIVSPSLTWYLAEGATHSGFRLFYLLQNPNPVAATVDVTYLRTGLPPLTVTCTVPAKTRKNIYANAQLCPDDVYVGPHPTPDRFEADDVSAVFTVTNGQPIIVERAMYRGPGFAAGTATAGVTSPATSWFLAEGATGDLFDTYVLLANPSNTDATFELDLLRLTQAPALISPTTIADPFFCAPVAAPCPLVVPAGERRTIRLDGIAGAENDGMSTVVRVTNGVGVLVERAMWWPGAYATWTEGHASFGTTTTGTTWGLADGEVGGPRGVATYVLVANTSAFDGRVRATLLFEDGTAAATTELTVPANARANFNFTPATIAGYPELASLFPPAVVAAGKRFGVIVESVPQAWGTAQIVVERAMYSADGQAPSFSPYWPAGTNALGTKLQ